MTKREKELEDTVQGIILEAFNEYREQLIKAIAKHLAEEGYTKSPFDVEELKRWLGDISLPSGFKWDEAHHLLTKTLDKIKELEDG